MNKNVCDTVLATLHVIYDRHRRRYRGNTDTGQMCCMWSTRNPPDILEGTKPLLDIEAAFDIDIDEDAAVALYDMHLEEAARTIMGMQRSYDESQYLIGDSVMVKPHVLDPDFGIAIGGWQGTVSEISDEYSTVCIDWDSHTLQAMPSSVIDACESKGLSWTQMYLAVTEVEAVPRRAAPKAVAQTVARLQAQHMWSHLEEEGAYIQAVIGAVDPDNTWAILETWESHLRHVLRFPFAAEVSDSRERGPLRAGDRVTVEAIACIDDLYGVLVTIKHDRRTYQFPLCDLKVSDHESSNHEPVRAYVIWFANR